MRAIAGPFFINFIPPTARRPVGNADGVCEMAGLIELSALSIGAAVVSKQLNFSIARR
jgi:hypothetical protein